MSKVTYTLDDNVAVVAMDDGKANAFDFEMFEQLNTAMDKAEADGAKLVIFTGRAGLFCGGLNLKLMPSLSQEQLLQLVTDFGKTMSRIFLFPVPTVAAIAGHTIAGGMQLALACDRRVVLDADIRLQMNEMFTGMIIPSWMCHICKRAVPVQYHAELLLHAHTYSPSEALAKGIINAVAPADSDLMAEVKKVCADLLMVDKGAYSYTKALMHAPGLYQALDRLPQELSKSYSPR